MTLTLRSRSKIFGVSIPLSVGYLLCKFYQATVKKVVEQKIIITPKTKASPKVLGEANDKVQRLQHFAGMPLSNNFDYVNTRGLDLLRGLNIMNFKQRAMYIDLIFMFKCIHGLAHDYLCTL